MLMKFPCTCWCAPGVGCTHVPGMLHSASPVASIMACNQPYAATHLPDDCHDFQLRYVVFDLLSLSESNGIQRCEPALSLVRS